MLLEQLSPQIDAKPTLTCLTIVPNGSPVVKGVAQLAPVDG